MAAWNARRERMIVFDADYHSVDIKMDNENIARAPEELYLEHLAHPNGATRDFIEYYVLWSWHYNWYPNASVNPFDTSPGPNLVFDPFSQQ